MNENKQETFSTEGGNIMTEFTSYNQLPLALSADDIAAVLGISRANAYNLLHREDFPTLHIGKRMVVPKDKFLSWVDETVAAQSG